MHRINTMLIVLCALSLSACSVWPRNRTEAILDDVEAYINERPDSALAVLRALDSAAIVRGPAQRARAALLHSMALDKCYIDLQTDSVLAPAVAWYARHGTPDEKLKTLYYLGRLQYNGGDYPASIVTYTEALDLTDKATDLKYIGLVNQAIADTYSITYQEGESFPYLEKAYQAFIHVPDTSMAKMTLYKKALSSGDQRRKEESDSLFKVLLSDPGGIEQLIPRIKAAYALKLLTWDFENSDYSALLFQEALEEAGMLFSANQWAAFAYSLFMQGDVIQSEKLFKQLELLYPEDSRVVLWRSQVEYERGHHKDAFDYFRQGIEYQDSLLRIQLGQATIRAQKEYFEIKAINEEQSARRRANLLWLFLLLLCIIAVFVFIAIKNRLQQAKLERLRLLQTIDVISRKKEKDDCFWRHQVTELFQEYFNTLGKICADYEEGKFDKRSSSDRAILRHIDFIIRDFTGNKGNFEKIEGLLNKHLNNIMSDFRRDYPGMRSQRYQLIAFIFAGLDLQSISVLMGIEVDQVYTRKYRIKTEIMGSSCPEKERYLEFF